MNESVRPRPVNSVDRVVFRDMCRAFAQREIEPRWREADAQRRFPREFYVAAARAGLIGLTADESVGGAGLGWRFWLVRLDLRPLALANPHGRA